MPDGPSLALTVTVCVPCFEQAEYLESSLGSIAAQTRRPLEVIVVDDGSVHDREAIAEITARFGYRLLRITNRGLPGARNAALMCAKGDGFLPLDADDWIDHRYLELTVPRLLEADVVMTGLQEHGPTRNGTYFPGYDRPVDQVTEETLWEYNRFFYCSLFRTSTLRGIGGYNGRMVLGFEDWDVWLDLTRRGARFTAVNEVLFHYRTRDGSMLSQAEARRGEIVAEMRRHHGV